MKCNSFQALLISLYTGVAVMEAGITQPSEPNIQTGALQVSLQ